MKPWGYWTFERCKSAALKCKTKQQFRKYYESAYNVACKNDWLNKICGHLIQIMKSPNYWTKERCQQEALRCKTKAEFRKKYQGAYSAAFKKDGLMKYALTCML
jgi:hypothetical protein